MIQRNLFDSAQSAVEPAGSSLWPNEGEIAVGLASRLFAGAVVVGLGVVTVAVVANGPKVLRTVRPVLRQALKRGLEGYALIRGAAAELAEDVEDLVAEVQAELRPHAPGPSDTETKRA